MAITDADRAKLPLSLANTLRLAADLCEALGFYRPDPPRPVMDKSGKKIPGNIYVMRQPNGQVSAFIARTEEGFSAKCEYLDLGPAPQFPTPPSEDADEQ